MKLNRALKLSSRGFGHIELISAAAVVAVVGVAGLYVSKHNTSHAASYNYTNIGSYHFTAGRSDSGSPDTNLTIAACKLVVNSKQFGPLWSIQVRYTFNPALPSTQGGVEIGIDDMTSLNQYNPPTVSNYDGPYLFASVAETSFYVSQNQTNYLRWWGSNGNNNPMNIVTVRAGNLAPC